MERYKPPKVPVLDCFQQTDLPRKRSGVGCKSGVCSHKKAVLNPFFDAFIINANDQNPIVSQQVSFYGLAKSEGVKSFSETLLVVHINDFNAELFRRLLQTRFINSGSCGSEQTPFALYQPIIKNCPEHSYRSCPHTDVPRLL